MHLLRSLLIVNFCLLVQIHAGDLDYQIGFESGILKEQQEDSQLLLRLIGRFRYDHSFDSSRLNIKLRLAPEGYFSITNSTVLRTSAQLRYSMPRRLSQWDFILSSKHHTYSLLESDKQNYMFIIGGIGYQRKLNRRILFRNDFQLIYRIIDALPSHRLKGIRLIPKIQFNLFSDYTIQGGFYGEPFEINSGDSLNTGWRVGTSLAFRKQRNPTISFNYLLLYNKNSYQKDFSAEQHFELLLGNPIANHWSIFFYANYYLLPDLPPDIPIELVYTPLNTQNWIYLQTAYDITRKTEIYTRAGYIYEEVNYGLQTIRGWQFLMGINIVN